MRRSSVHHRPLLHLLYLSSPALTIFYASPLLSSPPTCASPPIPACPTQRTVDKVSVLGSSYLDELSREISAENIPALAGGSYTGYAEDAQGYFFDQAYFVPRPGAASTRAPSAPSAAAADADNAMPPLPPSSSGVGADERLPASA